ncbi:EAL domain-containing protein [bacterium]|nr:EAL domain-containing protein [bacterium]
MAKKGSKKFMKMTASQQYEGLQFIMDKIRSKKPVADIFQEIVNEFPASFPFVRIDYDSGSCEAFREIETADSISPDATFLFYFPNGGGALIVGHSDPIVRLDDGLSRWLENVATVLGLALKSAALPKRHTDDEYENLKANLQAAKEEAHNEIERVKEEAQFQIRQIKEQTETGFREQALWDELTLLPNSKLFPLMMSPMLAHARRSADLTAVMFLEIGRLDEMTKTHGFHNADRIIKQALELIMKNLREGDVAVRAGANRILWSLGGLRSIEDTATVAEKMLLSLSRPLEVDGKLVSLSGSIGISLFPVDGSDPETLMNHAEIALEVSRKTPGNSIRFYSREMNEKIRTFLVSRKELKDATAKQEFALHYQPVVRFSSNEAESVEALIRWRKPQGLTVYPGNFLDLSEQIGIASQLDEWMIRTACLQRNVWEKEGLGSLRVSVNLSQNFFWEGGVDRISHILRASGMRPDLLELEIAEKVLLKDAEKVISRLKEYSDLGVNLTIDDFGSIGGLLMNLSRYQVQAIKLYPGHIRGITQESAQSAVVASTLFLAHSLKIRVIAKAVETQSEHSYLEKLGCDGYQGNLFSPALPKNLLTEFLRKQQMKAAPATASTESTQPMEVETPEQPIIGEPAWKDERPSYVITCFNCQTKFNANEASWCLCITPDSTVVCPSCKKCFCRATLDYRHGVWGSAPESFWDRKNRFVEESGPVVTNPPPDQVKHPLVLVVDDEPGVLKVASRLIRGLGYSVILARNGEEGLQVAKDYKPELVISDALMPKLDGREMCSMLKRDPVTARIKAVIMTAFTGAAKYKSSVIREYQFDEHLQKPVEYDRLVTVLRRFLG